ncbi:hypothetical protein EHM92_02630, partial [bacterium]
MTPRLLILSQTQFGSHIDPYQYSRYLKDRCEITFVCWDYDFPRVEEPGVIVMYVSRQGGKLQRLARFIGKCIREIREGKYDLVFVVYFQGSSLLPLLSGRRRATVLDIRTGYVRGRGLKRWISNRLIYLESLFYRHVTIISESLRSALGIPLRKSYILPLGAEYQQAVPRTFEQMHLLYIGTLQHRSI